MHDADQLIKLFNSLFANSCNTELVGGAQEPEYRPASGSGQCHQIIFTRDYFSSALHEISHWCVAGSDRRQLVDFGYWYQPDGRSAEHQQAFEQVEIKPQALEWIFSAAAGINFNVSVDNLNITEYDSSGFSAKVYDQVGNYLLNGLPRRAQRFVECLTAFYQRQQDYAAFCQQALELSRPKSQA